MIPLLTQLISFKQRGDPGDPKITSIGNPLMQSIHKYWPSVQIRFESATTLFMKSLEANSDMATRHVASLLSRILDVIASISDVCGDFIVDRFLSGIWPYLTRIFVHLLPKIEHVDKNSKLPASSSFSKFESVLLTSMLNCIKSIYSSKDSVALSESASTVGIMLLPLLSQQNDIGKVTMDVMETLLQLDCDCLWRALHSASGKAFKTRHLLGRQSLGKKIQTDSQSVDKTLANRADTLIAFINALPEQRLL
jgi:hypothetical protein